MKISSQYLINLWEICASCRLVTVVMPEHRSITSRNKLQVFLEGKPVNVKKVKTGLYRFLTEAGSVYQISPVTHH